MYRHEIRYRLNNMTNLTPLDIGGVQISLHTSKSGVRFVCAADGAQATFRYSRAQSVFWHERDDLLQTHNECLDQVVAFIERHAQQEVGV